MSKWTTENWLIFLFLAITLFFGHIMLAISYLVSAMITPLYIISDLPSSAPFLPPPTSAHIPIVNPCICLSHKLWVDQNYKSTCNVIQEVYILTMVCKTELAIKSSFLWYQGHYSHLIPTDYHWSLFPRHPFLINLNYQCTENFIYFPIRGSLPLKHKMLFLIGYNYFSFRFGKYLPVLQRTIGKKKLATLAVELWL